MTILTTKWLSTERKYRVIHHQTLTHIYHISPVEPSFHHNLAHYSSGVTDTIGSYSLHCTHLYRQYDASIATCCIFFAVKP